MNKVSMHYDLLIKNGNDPMQDSVELQEYMDKWDGDFFVKQLGLDKMKTVLEIGCGTGRILRKIQNNYKNYTGIDISSLTVKKAKEYFSNENIFFINDDFLKYNFNITFDVIYSTLTFMHIKDKKKALEKIYLLLNDNGRLVLSVDKNQNNFIDTGYSKIKTYPDNAEKVVYLLNEIGFQNISVGQLELAHVITANKID